MSSFDAWRAARLASAILLISGAAAGRDDAVDEILRRSQQTVNHAAAIAGEDAADIRRNHPEAITDDGAWLSGRPVDLNEDRVGEAATAQQRAWNEAMGQAAAAAAAVGRGPPHPAVPDNVVYVFISLSMPDGAIRLTSGGHLPSESHRFYENVVAHLRDGADLVISPEWARRPIHILDLAGRSAREGVALRASYG